MSLHDPVVPGRTGLKVGRPGIASGYGGPMSEDELARMRRIGDRVYGRKRP